MNMNELLPDTSTTVEGEEQQQSATTTTTTTATNQTGEEQGTCYASVNGSICL